VKHVWTVFCHRGIVDRDTNQISLISVIERITVRRPAAIRPADHDMSLDEVVAGGEVALIPLKTQLISLWTRSDWDEPEVAQSRTRMIGPNGKILVEYIADIDLTSHINRRGILKSDFFPYYGEGVYRALVQVRAHDKARWRQCAESFVQVEAQTEDSV
jgi:hypothetical protein